MISPTQTRININWNNNYDLLCVETSTPTRLVENVILTTKDLQDRNTKCWIGRR